MFRAPPKVRALAALAIAAGLLAALGCPKFESPPSHPGGPILGGRVGTSVSDAGTDGGQNCQFADEVFYPAETSLVALAARDLDGDGRTEVLAAGGTALRVWFPAVDGGLTNTELYATRGNTAALAVGPFEGSGLDVVVANSNPESSTEVLPVLGSGQLGAAVRGLPGRPYVQQIAAADFDEDGRTDLALAADNSSSGEIYMLLNPPAAEFFSGGHLLDQVAAERRTGVAAGDVNLDGHQDLVVIDPSAGRARLCLGRGDGGFVGQPDVDAGLSASRVALGDVDGDGRVDAMVCLPDRRALSWLRGTDAGVLAPGIIVGAAGSGRPVDVAVGDWNQAGHPGAVTAQTAPAGLGLYASTSSGDLVSMGSLTPTSDPRAVALGDVDGDGHPDIVALLDGGLGIYRLHCP